MSPSYLSLRIGHYAGLIIIFIGQAPEHYLGRHEWTDLARCLADCEAQIQRENTVLRGLVLTGTKKMFSLGDNPLQQADLSEKGRELEEQFKIQVLTQLKTLSETIPTVAAVSGYAVGTGWELAQCCGYRIMGDNGRLAATREGPFILPEEALKRGLVDALVAPDMVLNDAQEWALHSMPRQSLHSGILGNPKSSPLQQDEVQEWP